MAVATRSELESSERRRTGRTGWLLAAALLVALLAALGVWNPRGYVVIDEVLDHPFVAGMLVIALVTCALVGEPPEHRGLLRRALPVLLVAALALAMLVLGHAIEDERVERVVDVPGTELSISLRSYQWWDGGEKPAYLYLHSGSGLFERRIRVGEAESAYDDTSVRARLVEPGVLRVEWEGHCCTERSVDYWMLAFDPDDLRVTRIESSYGCDEQLEIPCVAAQ